MRDRHGGPESARVSVAGAALVARVCAPPPGLSSRATGRSACLARRSSNRSAWSARACCARGEPPQQGRSLLALRFEERRDRVGVEAERLGRFLQAIAEPDALLPVDHDAEPLDDPFVETHISSRPSSLRAVSMTTGVISPMPRSLA